MFNPEHYEIQALDLPSVTVNSAQATRLHASRDVVLAGRWTIQADEDNPGTVYIGGPGVAADGTMGFKLVPGATLDPPFPRPYNTFARATVDGCKLHFLGG